MSKIKNIQGQKRKTALVRTFLQKMEREGISKEEVISALRMDEKKIPTSIFRSALSPLQACVKYLFERGMRYHEIAEILGRDHRTIWNTYRNASPIMKGVLAPEPTRYHLPLHIFSDRRLSFLEHVCMHLRERYALSYHEIAVLIGKNDRTVWTVCKRAERKHGR